MYFSSRYCRCRVCFNAMQGILTREVRDTCEGCGGTSLVKDSEQRIAARERAAEEFGGMSSSVIAV